MTRKYINQTALTEEQLNEEISLKKLHTSLESLKKKFNSIKKRYDNKSNIKGDLESIMEIIAGIATIIKAIELMKGKK